MQALPPNPPEYSPDQQKNGVIAPRFFWATVFLLAFITVALTVVGSLRSTVEKHATDSHKEGESAIKLDPPSFVVETPFHRALVERQRSVLKSLVSSIFLAISDE